MACRATLSNVATAAYIVGAAARRCFGPDRVSAPTSSPVAPNTGTDAEAVSASRSPYDAAHSRARTSLQRSSPGSVKARNNLPEAPRSTGKASPTPMETRTARAGSTR
ncbi:hypothetical protein D9M68_852890 [compost metagenome]